MNKFHINAEHWLEGVKHCPSPFCNQRQTLENDELDISLLVLHHISLPPRQFGGPYIEQLFTGTLNPDDHPFFESIKHLKVSAHCLIRRDGEVIQFVPFDMRAWHAGVSSFAGREACNDYSIGIELEGSELDAYTEAQYQSLQAVTKSLQARYPKITRQRITGHQFIAPLRKPDPGLTFNWRYYFGLLG